MPVIIEGYQRPDNDNYQNRERRIKQGDDKYNGYDKAEQQY